MGSKTSFAVLRDNCSIVKLAMLYSCIMLQEQCAWGSDGSKESLSAKEFYSLLVKTYGWKRQLDTVVVEDGGLVNVTDIVYPISDGFMAMRLAVIKIGTHSSVKLMLPKNLTRDAIDTTKWKIDKTYIRRNFYYQYMIEAMFQGNAIKLSRNSKAKVLSIGLGGGTIDGFLHHVFPQMNITAVEISPEIVKMARKWFGLQEDDRHRVEIADGITFLAKAARKGIVYDAILLDACSAEPAQGIICPMETFLSDGVLENIGRSIHKEGFFVANVLSTTMSTDEAYKYVVYCSHKSPVTKPRVDIFKFLNDTML